MAARGEALLLMPPYITFESAINEQPLPYDSQNGDQISSTMMSIVHEGLHKVGFKILTYDSIGTESQSAASAIIQRLNEESRVLTSYTKDKSALFPSLKQLSAITGSNVVCVQTVRAKIGRGASYNSSSGAMSQGTSTSAIRVVMLSLDDGSIVWSNESFARDKPSSNGFRKAVKMLFKTSK